MKKVTAVLLLSLGILACNSESTTTNERAEEIQQPVTNQSNFEQDAATKAMVNELKSLWTNSDPEINIYLNEGRAKNLKYRLENGSEPAHGVAWFDYCIELLRSGESEKCIKELEGYFDLNYPLDQQVTSNDAVLAIELLALANLRLGEQENCQNKHTAFSCIVPLKEPGVHELRRGSERAIELYEMMYDNEPKDYYKWLINLAYMTLGEHPENVPEKYLIPFPNNTLETKDFPRFKEVSMTTNVAQNGLSGGTCLDDFNNDGYIDIFTTGYGITEQSHLFINDGNGSFEDRTEEAGLTGIVGGLNCIHADYDNDGDRDIFILRGAWLEDIGKHPNSLLRNNGDGTFSDVTKAAGLLSHFPTQTASWADYNKDGYLDLFIGNESFDYADSPSELYKNNGDGTFEEVSAQVGLGTVNAFIKGVSWGDLNNDGWPDLFISVYDGKNMLFKNNEGQFENVSASAGVEEPLASFPCWWWDVNNDGMQDLFVAGYNMAYRNAAPDLYSKDLQGKKTDISHPAIYINTGNGSFTNKASALNVDQAMFPMGCNYGDLDNDGLLDFYLGTGCPDFSAVVPNRMFRNVNGNRFEEVTSAGGFGHVQKGHGVGFADLDNDGDQDIYAVMGGAFSADKFTNILFENPGFENNWIVIDLQGVTTNRDAIGTRLEVTLDNGRKIYRVVSSGGSFGASSLQQEIGLGSSATIKNLKVYWQNGEIQEFNDLLPNQKIKITEGKGEVEIFTYTAVPFSTEGHGGHVH